MASGPRIIAGSVLKVKCGRVVLAMGWNMDDWGDGVDADEACFFLFIIRMRPI